MINLCRLLEFYFNYYRCNIELLSLTFLSCDFGININVVILCDIYIYINLMRRDRMRKMIMQGDRIEKHKTY